MNVALSLDESHDEGGEELVLRDLIASNDINVDEQIEKQEVEYLRHEKLMGKLSEFEQDVYVLYIKKYHYEEIRDILSEEGKNISRKSVDNAVQRVKAKSRNMTKTEDLW